MAKLSAKVKIDVTGINAVVTAAKKRQITLAGAKAAAKPLKVAARAMAPRRRGKGGGSLKKAQAVKAAKGTRGKSTASYAVQGVKKSFQAMVVFKKRKKATRVVPAFYDHLVQLGVKPHSLRKGALRGRTKARQLISKLRLAFQSGGKHPGTKANPYRKRAWESVKEEAGRLALAAMAAATQKEIARQVAKYGRPKG